MKTLTVSSAISVLCAVVVVLYFVPQLLLNGVVEINAAFELMVVLPTLVGVASSFVGALFGLIALVRRVDLGWAKILMAVGQVVSWALVIVVIVWATKFGSTGWELLALPHALLVGQFVVATGLVTAVYRRRKQIG
ncbi:hypothetical protein IEU95_07375 [Hoyosella rhizosphaerae]|uniref:Uncharacterized protein n=1 Tax=Hoyosella rhizosphaerae TaxID=1755582 RepID=A0A916U2Y5_9ACTN|nr:hypothetical protein [Hoyosella rhizosphaerae]MBN4926644.1 hypothetical protein [Hoyosella rhizosphaerae]GGC57602.1 hypothetical protein GCM10011410_07650 [Hoyosella rhizosphaerae]